MATLLLDTFSGPAAPLASHTPDVGGAWSTSGVNKDLLRVDGAGLLGLDQPSDTVSLTSGTAVSQVDLSFELVVDVGTINTNPSYDRWDRVVVALWGWYDFGVEVGNGVTSGDGPYLLLSHKNSVHKIFAPAGQTHTVRFDLTVASNSVKAYLDAALVLNLAGALRRDVGSTALAGYFDRSQTAGAPNLATMLRLTSFQVSDAGPPPPPPAFWYGFQRTHEVP